MATKKVIVAAGDNIAAPHSKYNLHMEMLELPNTLMGGTEAMRAAGTVYLPQEEGESPVKYEGRLARSTLFEAYPRTIEKLVGEMFSEQIAVSEDMDEEVKEFFNDIDRNGNSVTMFCAKLMNDAIHEGLSHILVEYPPSPGKTVADHKAAGARPYWVHIKASQVIGWRFKNTPQGEQLVQLRIAEKHVKNDGKYGEKEVNRVRLLEPGKWSVYEDANGAWQLAKDEEGNEMQGVTNLDFIPFVTIMTGKAFGELKAKPPLLPLAHLNCTHWQSASDQRNILHYARLVTWFGRMLQKSDDGKILMGANRLVHSDDPQGDLKVVEHSGAAINAGRQDLEDLKTEMAMFGLSLMIGKTGDQTATEKAIDKGENSSALYLWATALNSALQTAVKYTGKYLKKEVKGELKAKDDFSGVLSSQDPALIIQAYQANLAA